MTGDGAGLNEPRIETAALLRRMTQLYAERRVRDRTGLFFVEGVRNLVMAVDRGWSLESLLFSDTLLTSGLARSMVRDLRRRGVPVARASPEEFRSISRARRASGVAAVVRQEESALHRVRPRRSGASWLVLSEIRSPGNLGTLLRTSAAAGGAGVILVGGAVDPYDPLVVRASMGALFAQRFVRTGVAQLASWIRRHRLQLVGASPDGSIEHFDWPPRAPPLIALGEERAGLSDELRALCDVLVRIPMARGVDSLNISVAGSLLLYEVVRSRRRR